MLGTNQAGIEQKIQKLIPGYMAMGSSGMGEMLEMNQHMNMPAPHNYLKSGSPGPFGVIGMGGMFTVLKVREGITNYTDPGWYHNPPGTVAESTVVPHP